MVDQGQQIRCSINNCNYWEQGNKCGAHEIMVTSDAMSTSLADIIDAPMAAQISQTPVQKSVESCCKTFVLRGDFHAFEDGITRM